MVEALDSTKEIGAFTAFDRLFKERGLPSAIRSDNGLPFASPNGLYNLSKLSVWCLRLGIQIERIQPGCPTQNGRHERMHLTLKKETTRPAGANSLQQQVRFDEFVKEFNQERPHQALEMKTPSQIYQPSNKPYNGLPEISHPFHDKEVMVTNCGRLCLQSTSQQHWLDKKLASKKSKTKPGWFLSLTMTSVMWILNSVPCKLSTIRSARDCHQGR
jgi:hypothetical protein